MVVDGTRILEVFTGVTDTLVEVGTMYLVLWVETEVGRRRKYHYRRRFQLSS